MAYKLTLIAATIVASTFTINSAQAASGTLNKVLTQGTLSCGVSTGLPGFSNPNARGEWEGIDVEYCQAVAAAVLGDKTKVKYVPLTAKERFTALQSGEVDIPVIIEDA
jgi:general L-amino acid transport system substrate-binding protein